MTAERNTTMSGWAGRRAWVVCLFALGVAVAFSPSWMSGTLITHEESVLRLPLLGSWRNIPVIFSRDFLILSEGIYRPLSYAALAVVRMAVPVEAAWLWHTLLISLHLLNAWMMFCVARRFVRGEAAAFAAAAFCFHPLASVLTNRINDLSILMGVSLLLGSLVCYLSFRERPRAGAMTCALVLFCAALLTSRGAVVLPVWLGVIEMLYRRIGWRASARLLWPFVALAVGAILLWRCMRPHPLLFTYQASVGGEWPSFVTIVAGSRHYLWGLLFGNQVPVELADVVRRIFTRRDPLFILFIGWCAIHAMILVLAAGRAVRRDPLGVGVLLIYTGLLPFLTTAWNPVAAYVSWAYLYAPLVGLALVAGVLADRTLSLGRSRRRIAGQIALFLLIGIYLVRLFSLDCSSRSAVGYWTAVAALHPPSETAQVSLGKAYLSEDDPAHAMEHLFTRGVQTLDEPCRAMCRHYLRKGDLFAASIHAGFIRSERAADLYVAWGALDHAESALGRVLAENPFHTRAMKQLARVFTQKGFVPDARRWLRRAIETDPSDREARDLLKQIEAKAAAATQPVRIEPPGPEWLRFLLDGSSTTRLRNEIIETGKKYPDDPVIQMRVGHCLLRNGDVTAAMATFEKVYPRLPSYAPLASLVSWALASRIGPSATSEAAPTPDAQRGDAARQYALGTEAAGKDKLDEAIEHFRAALDLAPRDARTHFALGVALSRKGSLDEAIWHYSEALRINPAYSEAHIRMGDALSGKGQTEEATQHFLRSLELRPDDPDALSRLAVACYRKGDYAAAWRHVHRCRQLGGSVPQDFLEALRGKMKEPER